MDKETIKATKKKLKSCLKARQFGEALELCESLLAAGVETAEIYTFQGVSYLRLKEYLESIRSFEKALIIDSRYKDALKGLSQCFVNVSDEIVPPQRKLNVFELILETMPETPDEGTIRKHIVLCHWNVADYELCFKSFSALQDEDSSEILHFMFGNVISTKNFLCYDTLNSFLQVKQDILNVSGRLQFYFNFASFLNNNGKDASYLINLMVSDLEQLCVKKVRPSDQSSTSTGSYEIGTEVEQETQEWWPSQTLKAQLWSLWDHLKLWNGAPKLDIPADLLEALQQTAMYLGKDMCPSKTVLNTLINMSCDNNHDALLTCREFNRNICKGISVACSVKYDDMCLIHGNATMIFLELLTCATVGENLDKIPTVLELLDAQLRTRATFNSTSLLLLVTRFRCYISYTLKCPLSDGVVSTDDMVVKAWSCLINKSQDILTCEHREPMMEATQQYILLSADRHVNVQKLLAIRDHNKSNFLYNDILIMALRKLFDKGEYDVANYRDFLNECYAMNKRNPMYLQYLGDLARSERRDFTKAAFYYEKSIRLSRDRKVLKLLDSLPLSESGVKEALIKSYQHLLAAKPDHSLLVRLALLCENDVKLSTKYLQQAQQLSKEPLIFELLGENYLKQGKYISAYKAFMKANELEATLFRQSNLAEILLILRRPSEGMEQFKEVLSRQSGYPPALLGCIKALHQQIVNALSNARYPHALYLADNCVTYIDQVIQLEPRWAAPWKYLGDMCVLLVFVKDSHLNVLDNVRNVLEWGDEVQVKEEAMLHLAVKCYERGLDLQPTCSEFLLDLGKSFLLLSEYSKAYLLHSVTFSKRAVNSRPRDHKAWNLLGCACVRRGMYRLAQHALIKSLNLERGDNPEAWTNLGLLYMLNQEYELANRCFGEAQSNAPKYSPCWVAQAFLARLSGHEEVSQQLFHDIIRDVSREATVEGTLSFAVEFCNGEMSGEILHDVLTLVTRCTFLQTPDQWLAHNMAGVLHEKLRLYQGALCHYQEAASLCPQQDVSPNSSQPEAPLTELVAGNVDRVQCRLGNYSDLSSHKHSLWTALALMRKGQYGMASSLLDNMSGQDVAVFQAVLCWLSKDFKTAPSFLQHTSSTQASLIRSFILSEMPSSDEVQSINMLTSSSSDIATKMACLKLHLSDSDLELDSVLQSPHTLYILVKFYVSHKVHFNKAEKIVKYIYSQNFIKEDLLELLIDCLKFKSTSLTESTNVEIHDEIQRLVLKSYHLFPWRKHSKQMFDSMFADKLKA